MYLQALDTIHVSAVSADNIITGQIFEINDLAARSLINRGLAIEVDGAATEKAAPAAAGETEISAISRPAQPTPIANKAGANTRTKAG